MNIAEATHATRIHHQWFPDILMCEKNLSFDTREILQRKGHKIQIGLWNGECSKYFVQK